jgi:hypothetical protein
VKTKELILELLFKKIILQMLLQILSPISSLAIEKKIYF